MASYNSDTGVGMDETAAPSLCHNVRGRLISRRGNSVYDIFQEIHGPGYSREEIDHALQIPSVRNSLHDELRQQNAARQRAQSREKAALRPQPTRTSTIPPITILGGKCFYHRAFGAAAKKCRPPCSFNKPCQQ